MDKYLRERKSGQPQPRILPAFVAAGTAAAEAVKESVTRCLRFRETDVAKRIPAAHGNGPGVIPQI